MVPYSEAYERNPGGGVLVFGCKSVFNVVVRILYNLDALGDKSTLTSVVKQELGGLKVSICYIPTNTVFLGFKRPSCSNSNWNSFL